MSAVDPADKGAPDAWLRRYRFMLAAGTAVLLVAVLGYTAALARDQRAALLGSLRHDGTQLQRSVEKAIDVVRSHVFRARYSVESALARPELADAVRARLLLAQATGGSGAAPDPDIGVLYLRPSVKVGDPVFRRNLNAAASMLSVVAATHRWSHQIEWTYFTDGHDAWFVLYPLPTPDELRRGVQWDGGETLDAAGQLRDVGPSGNPGREMVWTAPYIDAGGRGTMVTLLAPVYLDGAFVGAVAADITLKDLRAVVHGFPPALGRALVVDGVGNLLADSGAPPGDDAVVRVADRYADAPPAGTFPDGLPWLRFPLANTSWSLLLHVPEDAVRDRLRPLLLPYYAAGALLLAGTLFAAWRLTLS